MSRQQICTLLMLVAGLCLGSLTSTQETGQNLANTPNAPDVRYSFKPGNMTKFVEFKATFKKSYRSSLEELVRFRLFLMRSTKVFITKVAYKYRRLSFYLAINDRSDWTQSEIDASRNKNLDADSSLSNELMAKSLVSKSGSEGDSDQGTDELEETHSLSGPNEPGYRHIEVKLINEGPGRDYTHLPVKDNFVLQEESIERIWNNNWYGSRRFSKAIESDHLSAIGDIVWADHRHSNCMQQVRDQKDCGSCYAFATVAFLEWAYCREARKRVKFSEQYLVDCGKGMPRLFGCQGGAVVYAAEYILNFGLELNANYPYHGRDGNCSFGPNVLSRATGSMGLNLEHVSMIPMTHFEEHLKSSPIVLNIETFDDFDMYGGGVYNGNQCQGAIAGHSVLLIGHGREDGQEYWLLRNSFGSLWGEMGHMKLNKNNNCMADKTGFILGSYNGKDVQLQPEWSSKGISDTGRERPLPGVERNLNLFSFIDRFG